MRAGLLQAMGLGLLGAATLARAAVAVPGSGPLLEPGGHEAQMCVTVAAQPARCGPVQLHVLSPGQWTVRVDDIAYRLQLRGAVLDAFVFHGTMQIDEFTASARFVGDALEFFDEAKSTRFSVRPTLRPPTAASAAPAASAASAPGG